MVYNFVRVCSIFLSCIEKVWQFFCSLYFLLFLGMKMFAQSGHSEAHSTRFLFKSCGFIYKPSIPTPSVCLEVSLGNYSVSCFFCFLQK